MRADFRAEVLDGDCTLLEDFRVVWRLEADRLLEVAFDLLVRLRLDFEVRVVLEVLRAITCAL